MLMFQPGAKVKRTGIFWDVRTMHYSGLSKEFPGKTNLFFRPDIAVLGFTFLKSYVELV